MINYIKTHKILTIVIVLIIIATMYWFWSSKDKYKNSLISVQKENIQKSIEVSGKITPSQDISASFQVGGVIESIFVQDGDMVVTGQKLAKLNTSSIESKLKQQEIALKIENLKLKELEENPNGNLKTTTLDNLNKELQDLKDKNDTLIIDAKNTITDTLSNKLFSIFDSDNNYYKFKIISCNQTLQSTTESQRAEIDKIIVTDTISAKKSLEAIDALISNLQKIFTLDCMKSADYNVIRNNLSLAKSSISLSLNNIENRETLILQKQNQITLNEQDKSQSENINNNNTILREKLIIEQLIANISDLRSEYNKSIIYSPVNGFVGNINIEKGQNIKANDKAMRIISDGYEIEALLSESDIVYVKPGQIADIKLDALDIKATGTVSKVDNIPQDDSKSIKYKIKVHINNNDKIYTGMSATANIIVQEKSDVLTVPYSVIKREGSKTYILGPNKENIYVETGIKGNKNNIEIISGLKEKDQILNML